MFEGIEAGREPQGARSPHRHANKSASSFLRAAVTGQVGNQPPESVLRQHPGFCGRSAAGTVRNGSPPIETPPRRECGPNDRRDRIGKVPQIDDFIADSVGRFARADRRDHIIHRLQHIDLKLMIEIEPVDRQDVRVGGRRSFRRSRAPAAMIGRDFSAALQRQRFRAETHRRGQCSVSSDTSRIDEAAAWAAECSTLVTAGSATRAMRMTSGDSLARRAGSVPRNSTTSNGHSEMKAALPKFCDSNRMLARDQRPGPDPVLVQPVGRRAAGHIPVESGHQIVAAPASAPAADRQPAARPRRMTSNRAVAGGQNTDQQFRTVVADQPENRGQIGRDDTGTEFEQGRETQAKHRNAQRGAHSDPAVTRATARIMPAARKALILMKASASSQDRPPAPPGSPGNARKTGWPSAG